MNQSENTKEAVIVLCRPEESRNVGSVCRAMKNMDIHNLRIVGKKEDYDEEKVSVLSVHAFDLWQNAHFFSSITEASADCTWICGTTRRRGKNRKDWLLLPEEFAERYSNIPEGKVAIVFPLEEKTVFTSSDPDFPSIWDISVRTLRRCMHETYMDCPFYEQLQYAMDCRSEILYTYAISADDRLARQAMEAFRRSQRPDGLVSSDAPSIKGSLIPGFSLYYLLMVYDHMMYFGDRQFVKLHLPAIDQILAYFDRNLNTQGLVGKIGGKLMRHKYWSFVDWTTKWDTGVPGATDMGTGAITMESLLYLYGLQHGAELADFCGRTGLAKEYQMRAETLRSAVSANCFGKYGDTLLIQDGPGIHEYSVHSQVFAILTGIVTPEEGKAMLKATVGNQNLPQASVSFVFYLFRALEVCDWYEKTDELWELWRTMLRNHMTTCVENDTDARSDCHAWASLICYEMPAVILGVRPAAPGFSKVHIAPKMGMLTEAAGDVITPHGLVHVNWKKEDDSCQISYELPAGMQDLT